MFNINFNSIGRCRVLHENSGAILHTDLPPEYGGAGKSFSATDLVAVGLGVCIATNIDKVCERHGIPLDAIQLQVEKKLSQIPKRIAALKVDIFIDGVVVTEDVKMRLEKAAQFCGVHRSLHPDVKVEVNFRFALK